MTARAPLTIEQVKTKLANFAPKSLPKPENFHYAAVLILLTARADGLHVLLCERASDDPRDVHRGQVSLPGGRQDPEDSDILATALREANEEVGLDRSRVEILGQLGDFLTISNYHVTPFVAVIDSFDGLKPTSSEIAQTFSFPLEKMRDPTKVISIAWDSLRGDGTSTKRKPTEILFVVHDRHLVWGATARILHNLVELFT